MKFFFILARHSITAVNYPGIGERGTDQGCNLQLSTFPFPICGPFSGEPWNPQHPPVPCLQHGNPYAERGCGIGLLLYAGQLHSHFFPYPRYSLRQPCCQGGTGQLVFGLPVPAPGNKPPLHPQNCHPQSDRADDSVGATPASHHIQTENPPGNEYMSSRLISIHSSPGDSPFSYFPINYISNLISSSLSPPTPPPQSALRRTLTLWASPAVPRRSKCEAPAPKPRTAHPGNVHRPAIVRLQ